METTKLLEEALKLPSEARAALAGSLIDSLDEIVDEDAEAVWATELSRRLQELDSGAVRAVLITPVRLAFAPEESRAGIPDRDDA